MTYAIQPGMFDLPVVHRVVRDGEGRQETGPAVPLEALTEQQLAEYEAELLLTEAHVAKEIARGRRELEQERRRRAQVRRSWAYAPFIAGVV